MRFGCKLVAVGDCGGRSLATSVTGWPFGESTQSTAATGSWLGA
jgi:hypothetical protein